jgi:hypothetical protein
MHMHPEALLMKEMPPSICYWMSEWPKLQIPHWITTTRLIYINVYMIYNLDKFIPQFIINLRREILITNRVLSKSVELGATQNSPAL